MDGSVCNNRGDIIDGSCDCYLGWFGEKCENSLLLEEDEAFQFWKYTFIILFAILFILTFKNLHNAVNEWIDMGYQRGIKLYINMIKSPKHLSLILISIISILRILWLLLDPFLMYYRINRAIERILFEIIYSLLYTLFSIILFVWFIIVNELSYQLRGQTKNKNSVMKFKISIVIRIILIFILQFFSSIIKAQVRDELILIITNMIYIAIYFFFAIFVIEFTYYGVKVLHILKEIEKRNRENLDNTKKRYNNLSQEKDLNLNSFDLRRNEYDIQRTKELIPRNSSIKLSSLNHDPRRRSISSNNLEIFEQPKKRNSSSSPYKSKKKRVSTEFDEISNNLDKISIVEKKIAPIINMDSDIDIEFIPDKSSFIIENPSQNNNLKHDNLWTISDSDRIFLNKKEKKNFADQSNYDFQKPREKRRNFTKLRRLETENTKRVKIERTLMFEFEFNVRKSTILNDKKVSKRILSLTLFGLMLEIAFALLSLVQFYTKFLNSMEFVIILLFITSSLEFISCIVIFILFTNEKSKEINNLRWITKVGNRNNNINKKFIFDIPVHYKIKTKSEKIEKDLMETLVNRINFLSSEPPFPIKKNTK